MKKKLCMNLKKKNVPKYITLPCYDMSGQDLF